MHFPVAIVLDDVEMQSTPVPSIQRTERSFNDFGQTSLALNVFTLSQKLLGLVAMLSTILAICKR